MKEVFVKVSSDSVRWFGDNTTGSEPILEGEGSEGAIGRTVKFLTGLSKARNEEWSFRFGPRF
jgi:hypothetical protein